MLQLWGRANAYNVMKPLWLLGELGLEFRHHDIGSGAGDLDTPAFRALNPMARIPVLEDGDAVVWESNTVMRYLANRFDPGGLYPDAVLPRSEVERWMDWELATLQPAFIDLFWGFYRKPEAERDHAGIERDRQRCSAVFTTLDRRLGEVPYLAGNDFSLADIACGVCLYRYFNMGLPVDEPPRVMDWYRRLRLRQRDAFRDRIAQPFDELAGRTGF